jgi:hypothetical protein
MTWVSSEPWGYVTYHHGRWDWRAGFGWLWIPGVYYSPAWVAWNSWDGYCGWAPMGYYNYPAVWGYGAWNGYHCWNVVPANHLGAVNVGVFIRGERHLIASCQGTGITTWNGVGPRPLNTPWVRTPVILRGAEVNNPGQIVRAMRREEVSTRLQAYDRQAQVSTGRVVLRQSGNTGVVGPLGRGNDRPPVFRETETRIVRPGGNSGGGIVRPSGTNGGRPVDRPIDRERPGGTRTDGARTPDRVERVDRPREGGADRRRDFEPRQRERGDERRPDPSPRERPADRPRNEDRPRMDDRRPAERPIDRERPREDRPRMEERRPEAPHQDSRPAPRQESRPAPRTESHPAPREERRGGR